MSDSEVDERTTLLRSDNISRHKSHDTSLRRLSTASLQPPYLDEPPLSTTSEPSSSLAIWVVVPISLIGVFIANADGSLVVASSQQIASEFNALINAQWLVTSYLLAQCASQPLYGKLSDVFGRKINLVVAYTFFAVGCFLVGFGQQYWQVIAGRAISGIGGAGMTALVSVIISDMVPVRSVAAWRSYVNVAATTGRALGGPVGGWLCDTIGWRWCFHGQIPITVLGMLLILWKMPTNTSSQTSKLSDSDPTQQCLSQKWKRIDVLGALLIASAITIFLLLLDIIAKEYPPLPIILLTALLLILLLLFYLTETHHAAEPILPIRLLVSRPTLTSYLMSGLQIAAQFTTYYSTPLYFQITANNNVSTAGLRLVPAVVGNALAGLLSGYIISRTGRYKRLTILSTCFAVTGYILITIRWRGDTSWLETMYIFAGGFGSGTIQSTTFIHVAASLDPSDMAIAGTTLYLAQNLFLLIGVQSATTILHVKLRGILDVMLRDAGVKHKTKIIETAVSSVAAIRSLPDFVRGVVVRGYVDSLTWTFGACEPCSLLFFSLLLLMSNLLLIFWSRLWIC